MKLLPAFLRASTLALLLLLSGQRVGAADTTELAEAKARLLEAFQRGSTDNDTEVKQLRAKIGALEYIAAAKMAGGADTTRNVSVDFAGGPASALIAAIAKANGDGGFNVVGEKADLAIDLPPFSIRNADPSALAGALSGILQPRGYILSTNGRVMPGQAPVFTLRKIMPYESSMDPRAVPQFQSFQLSAYLGLQSVDDIVAAIRAAWELDPSQKADALRIKFHPPTGILLVSGPIQAINIAQQVLNQLRKSPEPNPKTASDKR